MKDSIRFIGNLLFVLFLFTLLFSYAMFQGGFVSWFLFYSFLPILIYHIGLLFYPLHNFKVSRELSRHVVRAGDKVTVTLKLTRTFPFPLYYCVFEEVIPESLQRKDNKHHKYQFMDQPERLNTERIIKKMMFVGFQKEANISYTLDQLPRGEHQLQSIRIFTSDVFGFVKKERLFEMEDKIIVQPNERELRVSEGGSNFEQGSVAQNTFHLKNTNVATGVREYAPGDRYSWIHWKQTARNNTVMTKEFEQERSSELLIVLDGCHSKRSNPLAFEAAVELTLSLGLTLEKAAIDTSLLTIGSETHYFPLKQELSMKENMKSYLTRIKADGERPFAVSLKERMHTIEKADMLVILTTTIDDFFKQTIQELRQRGLHVVVIYIQSSRFIFDKEQEIISQLKKQGTVIQVLSEKELAETPLEVSIK